MLFAKLLTGVMVTGILGAAVPASAHSPGPRVHVGLDFGNVQLVLGRRPAPVARRVVRVDHHLLNQGVRLEREGMRLIDEDRELQWHGRRFHERRMVRRGEKLEARGYRLVREGRAMQDQARNTYVTVY
jgi:hypothetical protein